MSRKKWKITIFLTSLVSVMVVSLPIERSTSRNTLFKNEEMLNIVKTENKNANISHNHNSNSYINITEARILGRTAITQIRPGQRVRQYAIELTVNDDDTFTGRIVLAVSLTIATREDPIALAVENLNIQSVDAGVFSEIDTMPAEFNVDDGVLEIIPQQNSVAYFIIITYTGSLSFVGTGLFRGNYMDT